MTACSICRDEQKEHLSVWVNPDKYHGYGHYPKLACNKCETKFSYRYREHIKIHKYDPEDDDYFLGLSTRPGPEWQWGAENTSICWDCDKLVTTEKRGYGYGFKGVSIIFCQDCYRKRYHRGENLPPVFYEIPGIDKVQQKAREMRYYNQNQNLAKLYRDYSKQHGKPKPSGNTKHFYAILIDKGWQVPTQR